MSDAVADHGAEVVEEVRTSLVVEVENMLADSSTESERWEAQSIYRVPEWIKNMNSIKAYRPQVVALGPLHHDDPDLMPMEEHKRRAVVHLVKQGTKPIQAYIASVEEVAEKLEAAYGKDLGEEWRGEINRRRFVEMMVTDGCFLLGLMRWGEQDYAHDDPVFGEHGRLYMWTFIHSDVLMIENQLPLLVLQRLLAVRSGETPTATEINSDVLMFLGRTPPPDDLSKLPLGLHLLDLYHSSFIYGADSRRSVPEACDIMPCAVEIHEAGIHFMKSKTNSLLDVHLEHGVLSMPKLTVDDSFECIFLNLMVFERLHAGVGNDVTAYVFFMDNIINSAKDVSLLKRKGIVENYLGSDEAVAKLFNDTLSTGAVLGPSSIIHSVQYQVNTHCEKRWNKWRANFMHTYLRNPWVFISLLAAVILLAATLLQTVYTVVPFYKSKS